GFVRGRCLTPEGCQTPDVAAATRRGRVAVLYDRRAFEIVEVGILVEQDVFERIGAMFLHVLALGFADRKRLQPVDRLAVDLDPGELAVLPRKRRAQIKMRNAALRVVL